VSHIPGILKISASTIYRVLKEHGYSLYKKTVKLGLKKDDKTKRYEWCKEREH
jgi:hypothetical protein